MKKIIIAAVTVDGKISKDPQHTVDWTSRTDKNFFRRETKRAGVVIFGAQTYRAMGKILPHRLNLIMTRTPRRYHTRTTPGILEFTNDSPKMIIDKLKKRGYTTCIIGGGSKIYSLFLRENLVDEMYVTIAPLIFGKGVPFFEDMPIKTTKLKLKEIIPLVKGEVLLKYGVIKTHSAKAIELYSYTALQLLYFL